MAKSGKKNNDKKSTSDPSEEDVSKDKGSKSTKKGFTPKKIFVILLVLIAIGASAYIVYSLYFTPKGKDAGIYEKLDLDHISLPNETLKFCFEYLPDLYEHFIIYNSEIIFIDQQIKKIEGVAKKYPDQAKIAEKEKQIWIKAKTGLEKTFEKIQKPVQDIHVQYLVNQETGLSQVKARKSELTKLAETALKPVRKMTEQFKSEDDEPEGLINSTIYKIKKKLP